MRHSRKQNPRAIPARATSPACKNNARASLRAFLPRLFYTALFLALTVCILTHSRLSLYYAFTGLTLWFDKMIPALLPFMILSGVMVRMGLTEGFVTLVYPIVRPIFHVSRNVCYVMIMGFLCGFPMGAKCVSDLYLRDMIDRREAEFLLAFCNNIGPVYFCSFALPLLGLQQIGFYAFGMYGLPLLYGLALRYIRYRDIGGRLAPAGLSDGLAREDPPRLMAQLDDAICSALQSICSLGGYMVLFNLLNLLPRLVLGEEAARFLAPLLEITGGLRALGQDAPLYSLLALPFGGLSCIAQTYSCIRDTDLNLRDYIRHKLALTALTALWYGLWLLARH